MFVCHFNKHYVVAIFSHKTALVTRIVVVGLGEEEEGFVERGRENNRTCHSDRKCAMHPLWHGEKKYSFNILPFNVIKFSLIKERQGSGYLRLVWRRNKIAHLSSIMPATGCCGPVGRLDLCCLNTRNYWTIAYIFFFIMEACVEEVFLLYLHDWNCVVLTVSLGSCNCKNRKQKNPPKNSGISSVSSLIFHIIPQHLCDLSKALLFLLQQLI